MASPNFHPIKIWKGMNEIRGFIMAIMCLITMRTLGMLVDMLIYQI